MTTERTIRYTGCGLAHTIRSQGGYLDAPVIKMFEDHGVLDEVCHDAAEDLNDQAFPWAEEESHDQYDAVVDAIARATRLVAKSWRKDGPEGCEPTACCEDEADECVTEFFTLQQQDTDGEWLLFAAEEVKREDSSGFWRLTGGTCGEICVRDAKDAHGILLDLVKILQEGE